MVNLMAEVGYDATAAWEDEPAYVGVHALPSDENEDSLHELCERAVDDLSYNKPVMLTGFTCESTATWALERIEKLFGGVNAKREAVGKYA